DPLPPALRAIPPGPGFWDELARQLLVCAPDPSQVRVLVPTYAHIVHLRQALASHLGSSFIPPDIRTLSDWVAALPPGDEPNPAAPGERLMGLYAQLRELGWLKKLFDARQSTDMLPLARTLLSLADELTSALLPSALAQAETVEDRWHAALQQLSPQAAALLSNESQLVWNLWHAQRDARDPGLVRHARLQRLASAADRPLFWCSPHEPAALEAAFLNSYAQHQTVTLFQLGWSGHALPEAWLRCWPEICDEPARCEPSPSPSPLSGLRLFPADHLEHEAQSAASTVIQWLTQGRERILIVPQDRVVARRVRALLERAQVVVADETGWTLSTTRAAAVLASWLDLVASNGRPQALLNFIKSPFLFDSAEQEATLRLMMERALLGGALPAHWADAKASVADLPEARRLVDILSREADRFSHRKTVADWAQVTLSAFDALGMLTAMKEDLAGSQVVGLIESLAAECEAIDSLFTLDEWRALLNVQLEQADFVAPRVDQRVRMVPLNGVPLRSFDAAIIVGADAAHLPSPPADTLFFANSVRRELGLATRELRARQQLRDFAGLLLSCPQVVVSWCKQVDGEVNLVSPWIQRLELESRRQTGQLTGEVLPMHSVQPTLHTLTERLLQRPAPSAGALLPSHLSASAYNSLMACPYQFFASRMLKLRQADEVSEQPEKRDYGQWIHQILQQYHETIAEQHTPLAQRAAVLEKISDEVFDTVLKQQPAALGFAMRWKKFWPAYLDWANQREAEGWQFIEGEQEKQVSLALPNTMLTLIGRLDRVDRHQDGRLAVIDYKTSNKAALKKKLSGAEDHQLAFYGLLCEIKPAEAAYMALDSDKPEYLRAEPYDDWCEQLAGRLREDLDNICRDIPLPAFGVSASCERCEMGGLCRKGAW
ncbi:MAG: PD-(D/E)XK nuclease family protein, partial [Oxalobacteraceae bacterium]